MTRVIILILSLFLLNHCSFNENSRIWKDKEKNLESKKNIKPWIKLDRLDGFAINIDWVNKNLKE